MFEWDKLKAKKKQDKHGILFSDTFAVFEDPNAITIGEWQRGEQRYITIGMDAFGRILVVVYAWREDRIRIISARKAIRHEVRQYEGDI